MVTCFMKSVGCRFNKFIAKIDSETGEIIEQEPKSLKLNESALV